MKAVAGAILVLAGALFAIADAIKDAHDSPYAWAALLFSIMGGLGVLANIGTARPAAGEQKRPKKP